MRQLITDVHQCADVHEANISQWRSGDFGEEQHVDPMGMRAEDSLDSNVESIVLVDSSNSSTSAREATGSLDDTKGYAWVQGESAMLGEGSRMQPFLVVLFDVFLLVVWLLLEPDEENISEQPRDLSEVRLVKASQKSKLRGVPELHRKSKGRTRRRGPQVKGKKTRKNRRDRRK